VQKCAYRTPLEGTHKSEKPCAKKLDAYILLFHVGNMFMEDIFKELLFPIYFPFFQSKVLQHIVDERVMFKRMIG
jgi:hypothetical protein